MERRVKRERLDSRSTVTGWSLAGSELDRNFGLSLVEHGNSGMPSPGAETWSVCPVIELVLVISVGTRSRHTGHAGAA
jgi:hypothetical protein